MNHSFNTFFCLIAFQCLMLVPTLLYAQNNRPQTQSPDSTELVVRRLSFEGNDHVKSSTLEMLIRTQTNREFLGIPGFTPWYFIHKLFKGGVGEEPALLNYETVATDLERITRYYNSIGFLEASADTNITRYDKNKARVTFLIDEGKRSHIQSVAYTGLPDSAFTSEKNKIEFYQQSDLTEDQINDSTFQADMPYLVNELDLERTRIINHLKNNGYATVQRDSITAFVKRDEQDKYKIDVLYSVNPGERYIFGNVHIKLAGPGSDTLYTYQESDTLQGNPYTLNQKKIYLKKEESAQTRFSLLTDQILFKPGDTFNNKRYIRSINEFQNLGMMSILRFGFSEDGSEPDYSNNEVPVYFSLQTLPKHSINFNVFGLKRYGFGSGAGITYTNKNLFGKAENLQLSVNGSFEYVTADQLENLSGLDEAEGQNPDSKFFRRFETRIDYSVPRLTFPFSGLDNYLFFTNARTNYSLSYSQSDQVQFDINSNITFNQRYEIQHNDRFTSLLDLPQLELLDANPSSRFVNQLCRDFGDQNDTDICDPTLIDSTQANSIALEQILEDFRPQFTSTLRYAFRSQRTNLIKRNYGYFSEYSISTGGNIPFLIDRFFVTPNVVEGTLPSPANVSDNSLSYSQYVKLTADYRRYIPLSNNTVFASRGFLGYARPFNRSRTIPLNQRFYAGGSNDIRGYTFFELGPGAIPPDEIIINGGEIKLLAQAELRQTFIENFLSSTWIFALFADAGNVWYGSVNKLPTINSDSPIGQAERTQAALKEGQFKFDEFYKQIAVSAGPGIRLDFDYLVARIDFAFRIHDLQKGWLNDKKMYFNFGIGHSF